jgi:MtN3 and saliva related transmembrane protein
MSVLSVLATIFGTLMAIANFPQAFKIFARKSARDISLITYLILLAGAISWILYGVEIKSFPLVISNIVGVAGVILIIIGWGLYGGKRWKKAKEK